MFDTELFKLNSYNIVITLVILMVLYIELYLLNRLRKYLINRLLKLNLKNLKVSTLIILNVGKQELIITTVIKTMHVLISLLLVYFSLIAILSEIPATERVASKLINLIFTPLHLLFIKFKGYLPRLFNIVISILIARYLIKALKYITQGVIKGHFNFPGFNRQTAQTTSGIISALIYIITFITILPNLPSYNSIAFKGVATFLGALITIGGSSVIANYMAGLVITYMHAFDKEDWVNIAGVSGKVIAKSTFAVHLKTDKGEAINIPNSKILNSVIHNYSKNNKEQIRLSTEISIGYDVPWKKVNVLLIKAAKRTKLLSQDKETFVLQKKLDNFYIVYELICFLDRPDLKPIAHSSLNAHILDVFNEAEIEILSPHFHSIKDEKTKNEKND